MNRPQFLSLVAVSAASVLTGCFYQERKEGKLDPQQEPKPDPKLSAAVNDEVKDILSKLGPVTETDNEDAARGFYSMHKNPDTAVAVFYMPTEGPATIIVCGGTLEEFLDTFRRCRQMAHSSKVLLCAEFKGREV